MNSRRRCASFERLESRHLMAGNIAAVMTGRDLLIEGDDFANTLSVSQSALNNVVLRGLAPDEFIAQTRINGVDTSLFGLTFENVTGNIVVRMRGGDDRLFFTGGRFAGPLTIDLGLGNDAAVLGPASLRLDGGLTVRLGEGQDTYRQDNVRIDRNLSIEGSTANDSIVLSSSSVFGGMSISGGAGFDAISVDRTAIGAFTGILGDGEGDRINVIHSAFGQGVSILGGAGGDAVELVGSRFDTTLFVALEADSGAVTIQGCIIASNTWLTAEGRANVRFLSSRAGRLEIATGPSHDTVVVDRSALDQLFVLLGEGNDELRVTGNQVARGGLFDGQGGIDSLFERVITNGVQRLGFEYVDIA
jgi:large repetitive protein